MKKLTKLYVGYLSTSTFYICAKFAKSRGLGKENDRLLIDNALDAMVGDYDATKDKIINIDDTKFSIAYNPYVHLFTLQTGSIASINGTMIIVDNVFRKLSKRTQYFVLMHEIGHYHYNHRPENYLLYFANRFKAIVSGKVLDMELEADSFAVEYFITKYCEKYGWNELNRQRAIKIASNCLLELAKHSSGLTRKELKLRAHLIINHQSENAATKIMFKYSSKEFMNIFN